jgi:hypothetical protein
MAYTFTVVPRGLAFTALFPADKVAKGFKPRGTERGGAEPAGLHRVPNRDAGRRLRVTHTMTNSPPYDWHLTNLRTFLTLDPKDVAASQRDGYTLRQLGTGDGMTGLPGDFKSAARFVSDDAHRLAYVMVDLRKLFAQNRKVGPVLFKDFVNRGPVDVTEGLK